MLTTKKGKKGGVAMRPTVNPVAAGVMGAVAGAAVGATAGIVLSNKKTRKKVFDAMGNLSDRAAEYTKYGAQRMEELRGKAVDMMEDTQKQLGASTQVAKKSKKKIKH